MISRGQLSAAELRFQSIYANHAAALMGYAMRRCERPADAQEVVADTFVVAWRRLAQAPDGDDVLPWLYAVERRVLANQQRGAQRRLRLTLRLRQTSRERDATEDETSRVEHLPVRDALSRLKPRDQEILRLTAWEDLSHRQIAASLGCTENAVAIRVHRARARLAIELLQESATGGVGQKRAPTAACKHEGSGGDCCG